MSAGPRTEFDFVEAFWQSLVGLDERVVARAARRRMLRTLAIAVLALLAAAAIALAASGVLSGSAAPQELGRAQHAIGLPRPGTVRLLPLRVADADHGPPWGVRLYATKKGLVCFQVGRVVEGRLVALGVAGAFGDDGRAHALPLEGEACGTPRGPTILFGGASQVTNRSGLLGGGCLTDEAVRAVRLGVPNARRYVATALAQHDPAALAHARRALRAAQQRARENAPLCRPSDERTIVAGTVAPRVRRVVATAGAQRFATAAHGFYLIVLVGDPARLRPTMVAVLAGGRRCLLPSVLGPNRNRSPALAPCDHAALVRAYGR